MWLYYNETAMLASGARCTGSLEMALFILDTARLILLVFFGYMALMDKDILRPVYNHQKLWVTT